jgi:ankyrin repeat protein
LEVVRKLLNAGANVNTLNMLDESPLHMAAMFDRWNVVSLLLSSGADVSIRSKVNGWTPLYVATGHSLKILERHIAHRQNV